MAAGRPEPGQAELEPEEEQQEDEAELCDEVGYLGGADERDLFRLVRAEEDSGEQVRGDRRQAEAARDEAERPERTTVTASSVSVTRTFSPRGSC